MNIIQVNMFGHNPLGQLTNEVISSIDRFATTTAKMEIEFKYAKIKQFCQCGYYEHLQALPIQEEAKKKIDNLMYHFISQQNGYHFETLKKLSESSIIIMNRLGRIYRCDSQFDELKYKKFYKIRQFLTKLCQEYRNPSSKMDNIYNQIRRENPHSDYRLINESEMRLDIIIKNGQHQGRYSYLVENGFVKTLKQNLIREQIDMMISERVFRLAIKKEDENELSFAQISQIFNKINSHNIIIRCKRAIRVVKNQQLQFSLSQIYHPVQQKLQQYFQDIKDLIAMDSAFLDEFVLNTFQNFYSTTANENKYEIQCEFTQKKLQKLAQLSLNRHYREIEKEIQGTISQLYALFHVDHNMKSRQSHFLDDLKEESIPKCRLQNEFGSYMHDMIHERMTQ